MVQARSLGLARSSGTHHDPELPAWLADELTLSKLWIDPEDLQNSYSNSAVKAYGVDSFLLCHRAGPE
jgi:hypothetical protein